MMQGAGGNEGEDSGRSGVYLEGRACALHKRPWVQSSASQKRRSQQEWMNNMV
jgi:hypothetical protein